MSGSKHHQSCRTLIMAGFLLLTGLFGGEFVVAADNVAFPEKFMFRLVSYSVEDADTDIAIFSESKVGAGVSFAKDLGGDTSVTVPRFDAYYRFNPRHRVDVTSFGIDRAGRELLKIDIEFEDQSYSAGQTVISDISYELFKIGYGYSFYHSPDVELGITAGLSFTSYDFNYALADGSDSGSSDVSSPLPMFGLRMAYAITPRWSIHYLSEAFFINLGDELEGALLDYEIGLQYRTGENFMLGAGVTRISIDLESDDEDWRGRIDDSHRGFLFYLGYQL